MNVLSLFDGMSCGQQALERAGIKVDNYFASEIDKHAIKVTMANYPDTIQLGSVLDVDGYKLPKIDLLIGGSPCQSFSFAGKRKGMSTKCETEILTLDQYLQLKNDGFEFEGQSYLFWEYMRILKEVKPKYFLLENVMMGEKWERILSKAIGVNPIEINSALVSAQNRRRLYWTNIGMVPGGLFGDSTSIIKQPKDKGILLKDILESEVDSKCFLSDKSIQGLMKHKAEQKEKGHGFGAVIKNGDEKMNALKIGGSGVDDLIVHNTMPRSSTTGKGGTGPLNLNDGKTHCLDTGHTNAVEIFPCDYRSDEGIRIRANGKSPTLTRGAETSGTQYNNKVIQINPSTESGGKQPYQQNRVYDTDGISPALCRDKADLLINTSTIRRLTPIECERLQTVKEVVKGCIFELCLDQVKTYVDVVNRSPRLLKLALIAEKSELNDSVKCAMLNIAASRQSIKHIALQDVDTLTRKQTKLCTSTNLSETNITASSAESIATNPNLKETVSADQSVFIDIIEGKIIHFGLEESLQKDKSFTNQTNGNLPLSVCGKEIMQFVEDAEKSLNTNKDNSFTYITSYPLNTRNLEKALIIYYLFAKNVITGYTQDTTLAKNILLKFNFIHGYTNHVSDSQRYKMLGNGWTVDVIVHILSYLPQEHKS